MFYNIFLVQLPDLMDLYRINSSYIINQIEQELLQKIRRLKLIYNSDIKLYHRFSHEPNIKSI